MIFVIYLEKHRSGFTIGCLKTFQFSANLEKTPGICKDRIPKEIWFVKLLPKLCSGYTEKTGTTLYVEHLRRVQRHEESRHDTPQRSTLSQKPTLAKPVSP